MWKKKRCTTRPIWATYLWTFNCFNFMAYFYFLTMLLSVFGEQNDRVPYPHSHSQQNVPIAKPLEFLPELSLDLRLELQVGCSREFFLCD